MNSPKPKKSLGKFALLQQQVNELTEALQIERADADNMRRRNAEQVTNLKTLMTVEIVRGLLPIVDNLERALKHTPKDLAGNNYVTGIQGVVKQFEKTLDGMGVKRIETVGMIFDPHLHEAVSMDGGDGNVEVVSEELQSGYCIGDEIIRHAMVKVKMEDRK